LLSGSASPIPNHDQGERNSALATQFNRQKLDKGKRPVKQQRLADRPQLIIEAAIPIIGRRGYYGFSIKSLAVACGLSVPGILHHFGSKQAILLAVLDYRERRDFEAVWHGLPFRDPEQLAGFSLPEVKHLLRETVVRSSQQADIVRLGSMLRTEALYPEHPAYEFFRDRNARSRATFTHMFTGKVPSPHVTAAQVIALLLGLETLWLGNPDLIDLVEQWDQGIEKLLG
jgi:AcrR family transcriptional regulator